MRSEVAATSLQIALTGMYAHPDPVSAVSGLTAASAGTLPEGARRTINELLGHLVYWQDVTLAWIDGVEPDLPSDPEVPWPSEPAPESEEAWTALVERFAKGIHRARKIARKGDLQATMVGMEAATVLGTLQVMANHNSYHVGQIVHLRRQLGEWPDG